MRCRPRTQEQKRFDSDASGDPEHGPEWQWLTRGEIAATGNHPAVKAARAIWSRQRWPRITTQLSTTRFRAYQCGVPQENNFRVADHTSTTQIWAKSRLAGPRATRSRPLLQPHVGSVLLIFATDIFENIAVRT